VVKITKSWGKVEHKNFVKTFYPLFLSLRNSNKLTSVCCLSLFTVHKVSSKDKNSKPSKDEKVKVDKKKSEEDEKKKKEVQNKKREEVSISSMFYAKL